MSVTITPAHKGRRVLIEAVLVDCEPDRDGEIGVNIARGNNLSGHTYIYPDAVHSILPPEIAAGGRVRHGAWGNGTVIAVHKDRAFVDFDMPTSGTASVYLSSLTPVEDVPGLAPIEGPEWIEWAGGPCPVAPGTFVEVRFDNGSVAGGVMADSWDWSHRPGKRVNITAYRMAS